jgi:hypothetical protein
MNHWFILYEYIVHLSSVQINKDAGKWINRQRRKSALQDTLREAIDIKSPRQLRDRRADSAGTILWLVLL